MPSLSCRAVTAAMWLTGRKRTYRSPEHVRRRVQQQLARPQASAPPTAVRALVDIAVTVRHGWRCYELTPRWGRARPGRVLYLHGGAYVFEISFFHWLAAARLVARSGVGLVMPIYPLAPLSTAANTVGTAARIAADLAGETDGRLTVIGDSAGGGLALAVAQTLRDRPGAQPQQLVLISPWGDVAMTDPASADIDRYDAMLHGPGCAEAGRIYAGDLTVDDPRVSPLTGDLSGLPPLLVFTGSHDILYPQAERLAARARKAGTPVDVQVLVDGQHDYPLLPMREGAAALGRIADLLVALSPPARPTMPTVRP